MVKKISAILLALVLCMSVVVMPVSAYSGLDLPSGSTVAYRLEWDKSAYSAGETAYLNIYMTVDEAYEYDSGSILIGLNSSVFSKADNDPADIVANSVASDVWTSFWKCPDRGNLGVSWLADTVVNKASTGVKAKNTDAENALYDEYVKIVLAKDTTGDHENAANNKYGLPGAEINAVDGPIFTLALVVNADVEDGTTLAAGITTGSTTCSPVQTSLKYMKSPGTLTTKTTVSATAHAITDAVTDDAVVGKATVETTPLEISHWKNQIRFETKADGSYYGKFDGRILMSIDNFDEVFASIADAEDAVIDAGFIFAKSTSGAALDKATAEAQVKGEGNAYSQVKNAYVSTAFKDEAKGGKGYVMSCMIDNVADADKATVSLSAMAYVIYTDANGETAYAFSPVETSTFESLYNNNFSQAFPNA